jgi:hypothetical protein
MNTKDILGYLYRFEIEKLPVVGIYSQYLHTTICYKVTGFVKFLFTYIALNNLEIKHIKVQDPSVH